MMKRLSGAVALALVAVLALVAASAPPANAAAHPLRSKYLRAYKEVRDRHGVRAPGRNIVKDGLRNGRRAPRARIRRSLETLERMLYVPKPAPAPAPTAAAAPTTTSAPAPAPAPSSSGGGGLPSCTWAPESGGDYGAYNPSSGASGKYQVIPSTHAAYCSDLSQSPSDQEECAGRIYEGQGAGAWVNC